MSEYEKAMIQLKLLELTQRQTLLAIAAHDSQLPKALELANEGATLLGEAIEKMEKLL